MIIGVSGLTEDEQGNRGSAGAGKDLVADYLVKKHGFVKVALADEIKRIAMRLWDFSEEQLWGPSELRNIPDERYLRGYALGCGCLAPSYKDVNKTSRPGSLVETRFWVPEVTMLCSEHDDPNWIRGLSFKTEPVKTYLTPRHALQQIGTEVARAVDPDVWVRFTMKVAKELLEYKHLMYSRTEGVIPSVEQTSMGEWERDDAPTEPYKGVVISDVRFPNEIEGIRKGEGKVWRKKRKFDVLPGKAATHKSEISLLDVPDSAFDAVLPDGDLGHIYNVIDAIMARETGRIIPYDAAQKDVPPFKRK